MSHNQERYREEQNKKRMWNKIWLWVGVIVLCVILFFWIFGIGTFLGPNQ
ncbi:MAG: hypothetical protein K2M14_02840 [Muribaculaceae bacterium]|nr:hypothetical protein [Muribaculaceae bacterium]